MGWEPGVPLLRGRLHLRKVRRVRGIGVALLYHRHWFSIVGVTNYHKLSGLIFFFLFHSSGGLSLMWVSLG